MSVFYVYEHWRPDRDECFYVGKGKGGRAYKMRDRNLHHRAIVKKLSDLGMMVEVRMVASGIAESEAFRIEQERIAFWRAAGIDLANKTNGGEGTSGLPAINRKMVFCSTTGEIFDSAASAAKRFGMKKDAVSQACGGRSESANGMFFRYVDEPHRAKDPLKQARLRKRVSCPKSYGSILGGVDAAGRSATGPAKTSRPVVCVDTGEIFPSASEAARYFGVCKSSVIELCLGKNGRKRVGGLVFRYGDV